MEPQDLYQLERYLKYFKEQLASHVFETERRKTSVDETFYIFSLHYGGEKGQEFRNHWDHTNKWLEDYLKKVNLLFNYLEDAAKELEQANI